MPTAIQPAGLAICLILLMVSHLHADEPARPNIILILADDMGYSDIGCFGGEIQTPNLDALAAQGTRMTQFYNAARCCPTRASLLTGLYPHQAGVGLMMADRKLPGYRGELNDKCVTLAEALGAGGYRTAMAGKWHLCHANIGNKAKVNHQSDEPFWKDKNGWPRQRGFQSFYGTIIGVEDYFDPFTLCRDNEVIASAPPKDFYYTDAISDEAVAQVRAGGTKPLFLYVAYTAPHWPLHAPEQDIKKYAGVYDIGWGKLREQRRRKLAELGIIKADTPLPPPEPEAKTWDDSPDHAWEARRMGVYAAQIDRIDQGIGRIMRALDEAGQADNTIVMFLSDNGGCAENVEESWFDIPTGTRDGRKVIVGNRADITPGGQESFQSYGPSWAMASNTPFRRYKHFVHEGGISTPFIVRWPGKIAAGRLEPEPAHVTDVMPTLLHAAQADYPAGKTPMQGNSLLGQLLQTGRFSQREFGWEHEGNRAFRRGDFKIVAERGQPWDLFNVAADRTESTNLAEQQPWVLVDLVKAYDEWAKRVGVEPWEIVNAKKP
jgi:arylsulfatase